MLARTVRPVAGFAVEHPKLVMFIGWLGTVLNVWVQSWLLLTIAFAVWVCGLTCMLFRETFRDLLKSEPEPKAIAAPPVDERVEWLQSNNPAVQALAKAGVFASSDPTGFTFEVAAVTHAIRRVSPEALDRIDEGIAEYQERNKWSRLTYVAVNYFGDRYTTETLREAAQKWADEHRIAAMPDGLVDIDSVTPEQWAMLDDYRLVTNGILKTLANPNLSDESREALTARLSELALCCKQELQDWQDRLTRQADALAKETLALTSAYLTNAKELTLRHNK